MVQSFRSSFSPKMASARASLLSDLGRASQPLSRTKTESRSSPQTLALRTRTPWLGTSSLSLAPPPRKPRLVAVTISLSLPTSIPAADSSSSVKIPKWSWRAIKSFAMGELEARKLKLPTTDTHAILMGILVEGTSLAAKFARANGITLLSVREETIKLRGERDLFFFPPEHPPMTEAAQRVVDSAIEKKIKSGESGEIPTSYLLLGIWSETESPGHKIMAKFGFNDEKAQALETLSSQPGDDDD